MRHHTDHNESLSKEELNEIIKESNDGLQYNSNKSIKDDDIDNDNRYYNDGAVSYTSLSFLFDYPPSIQSN